jgi:hypothetical protein
MAAPEAARMPQARASVAESARSAVAPEPIGRDRLVRRGYGRQGGMANSARASKAIAVDCAGGMTSVIVDG